MFGVGDEIFGKWETKCSEFRRTKVRRKSTAAYQEAQIKKKYLQDILETQLNLYKCHFFSPPGPL